MRAADACFQARNFTFSKRYGSASFAKCNMYTFKPCQYGYVPNISYFLNIIFRKTDRLSGTPVYVVYEFFV